jgi:hypothetical protein
MTSLPESTNDSQLNVDMQNTIQQMVFGNGKIENMNKLFKVTWEIELDAESAADAARAALKIQRDPDSSATVFNVENVKTKEIEEIDLFYMDIFGSCQELRNS